MKRETYVFNRRLHIQNNTTALPSPEANSAYNKILIDK